MTWLVPPSSRRLTPTRTPGRNRLQAVVVHATRTRTLDAALRWLTSPLARASGHLVIGLGGEVLQLAPLTDRTAHAGGATWRGRPVNPISVGVWLVGPGLLVPRRERLVDAWDRAWDGLAVVRRSALYPVLRAELARRAAPADGEYADLTWARLPEAQVASLAWVVELLEATCPGLLAADAMPGEAPRLCSDDALGSPAQVGIGPALPAERFGASRVVAK